MFLEAGNTSVQDQGGNLYTVRDEPGNQLWSKCTSSRGHFGTAHVSNINALVVARWPLLPDVAIADREAVTRKVILDRMGQLQGGGLGPAGPGPAHEKPG